MENSQFDPQSYTSITSTPRIIAGGWVRFILLSCLILIISSTAQASYSEFLGGWEGDSHRQGYAFLSAGKSYTIKGSDALITRLTGSYLYYKFDQGDSVTKVTSPGISFMVGISHAREKTTLTITAGPELRWNRNRFESKQGVNLSSERNSTVSGVAQGYFDFQPLDRMEFILLAAYSGGNKYSFGRVSIERHLGSGGTVVGLEGTGQGNSDIKAIQIGLVFAQSGFIGSSSLRISAGVKNTWGTDGIHSNVGFLGAGFYVGW